MSTLMLVVVIFPALVAVSVADVLPKKAGSRHTTFMGAAMDPLTILAALMYLFQVWAFLYAFVHKANLSTVSILQTVLYALITLTCAVVIFREDLSVAKVAWAVVAVAGVIGMNASR